MTISVKRLHDPGPSEAAALAGLVRQLSSSAPELSLDTLREVVAQECNHLLVAVEGETLVGCALLTIVTTTAGRRGHLDDVVVAEVHRKRGIGEMLVREALRIATTDAARSVDLTSRASRQAAQRLYLRVGFVPRETTPYRWVAKS